MSSTGRRLIIDAGSGIVGLGDTLTDSDHLSDSPDPLPLGSRSGPALLRAALFSAEHRVTLWAPNLEGTGGDVRKLFQQPFFPVAFDELDSLQRSKVVDAGRGGDRTDSTFARNHSIIRVARSLIAFEERPSIWFAPPITSLAMPAFDDAFADFASGAGVLILDAHNTPDEQRLFKGWGHSDWSQCAQFAARCGVGRLFLAHHKPGRTDDELDRIEAEARQLFAATSAACEGEVLTISRRRLTTVPSAVVEQVRT